MPFQRIRKTYEKYTIGEDISDSINKIKSKLNLYITYGFSVREIKIHYPRHYKKYGDIDNLTLYEKIYGETFDLEDFIEFPLLNINRTEDLDEIDDILHDIVLSSSENGDPDVIADYVLVYYL